jgi:hypothetical protein
MRDLLRTLLPRLLPPIAAVLAGCASVGAASRDPWNPDSWSFRRRALEPVVLPVQGPVAIDVESFGGDVIVEADARLRQATVGVVLEATHGYKRSGEAKASLAQIEHSAELVPGDMGPVLRVRTATTHAEPYFQRAHVRIDLPHADGVRVRTRWGRVELVDVEGTLDVETSEEDVRVMTHLALVRPVTILNRQGSIDYRVRGESSGAFDCRAIRGNVDARVVYGRFVVRSGTDGSTLLATLNGGTNPVVLRTVDGHIRIAVVADPTEIGASIVEP